MALNPTTRIFLWSAPRVTSTAVQRSVAQLPNVLTFHEPFVEPYHFGGKRKSDLLPQEGIEFGVEKKTFEEVTYDLIKDYDNYNAIFVKEHAFRGIAFKDIFPKTVLNLYYHSFIIRDPHKSVKSYYRTAKEQQIITGIDFFDETWNGWKELLLMFNYIIELGHNPIIIDANDIMKYPEEIMIKYCKYTGLKYNDSMLNWQSDIHGDWNRTGWHQKLIKTNTFFHKDKYYKEDEEFDNIPVVKRMIEEAMPYYHELCKYRINPSIPKCF